MLVVILISLLVFGGEVQAKESLNMKFDSSDQLFDRNRRDFLSFYYQIMTASLKDSSCKLDSCRSSADNTVCLGFCEENQDLFEQALTVATDCLSTTPCSQSLNQWQLSNVRMPLGVNGYDGECYLTGSQVTVTGENDVSFNRPSLYGFNEQSLLMYATFTRLTLTYSGLTVTCTSDSVARRSSGVNEYYLSRIVLWLLCLVSNLLDLGRLGLSFCFKGISDGGDAGDGGSSGSQFSAGVTVTQDYEFDFIEDFYSYNSNAERCNMTVITAQLDSGVPDEYKAQVKDAVELLLTDFYLINRICSNSVKNMRTAINSIYYKICPQADCKKELT